MRESEKIFYYFKEFFETSHFTAYSVLLLILIGTWKYTRIRIKLSPRTYFFLFTGIGLVLRIAWIVFSSYSPKAAWDTHHMLESDVTNVHAIELTQGVWFHGSNGQPTAHRPIGYSLFLGALYKLFGVHDSVVWISSLFFYLVTSALLYAISKKIFSEEAAAWAAAFFALYPISIYSIKLVSDEHLFLPLWYAGLWLMLKEAEKKPVKAAWLWYGLLFGYATMTRTHTIFMPVAVAWLYFRLRYSWRKVIGAALAVLVVMQLLNLPWVIRNYKVWGVPVLYTATGYYVYSRVNSFATAEGAGKIPQAGEEGYSEELDREDVKNSEGKYHAICSGLMTRWILSHPVNFAVMGVTRALIFFGISRNGVWPIWFQYYEGSYDPARPLAQPLRDFFEEIAYFAYYFLFYTAVFAVGLLSWGRRAVSGPSKPGISVIALCFLFWTMEQMVIYPDRKYRFPLEPLMMIFSAFFLNYLFREFRWQKLKPVFKRK